MNFRCLITESADRPRLRLVLLRITCHNAAEQKLGTHRVRVQARADAREAKIGHFHLAILKHQHVTKLEVAVVTALLMHVAQAAQNIDEHAHEFAFCEGACGKPLAQIVCKKSEDDNANTNYAAPTA